MCKNLDFLGLGKVSLCMAWLASLVIPQLSLSRQNQVNVSVIWVGLAVSKSCPSRTWLARGPALGEMLRLKAELLQTEMAEQKPVCHSREILKYGCLSYHYSLHMILSETHYWEVTDITGLNWTFYFCKLSSKIFFRLFCSILYSSVPFCKEARAWLAFLCISQY